MVPGLLRCNVLVYHGSAQRHGGPGCVRPMAPGIFNLQVFGRRKMSRWACVRSALKSDSLVNASYP